MILVRPVCNAVQNLHGIVDQEAVTWKVGRIMDGQVDENDS